MLHYLRVVLTIVFLGPVLAHAGAGANVYGCVYLPTQPSQPLIFRLVPTGVHCMNDCGSSASMSVTAAGVTCTSLGYVESKHSSSGGDTCYSDDHNWVLSYNVDGSPYTGSTNTEWHYPNIGHNSMDLLDYNNGTVLCMSGQLCKSTKQSWNKGTQGPLYIIFQPMYAQANKRIKTKS